MKRVSESQVVDKLLQLSFSKFYFEIFNLLFCLIFFCQFFSESTTVCVYVYRNWIGDVCLRGNCPNMGIGDFREFEWYTKLEGGK